MFGGLTRSRAWLWVQALCKILADEVVRQVIKSLSGGMSIDVQVQVYK